MKEGRGLFVVCVPGEQPRHRYPCAETKNLPVNFKTFVRRSESYLKPSLPPAEGNLMFRTLNVHSGLLTPDKEVRRTYHPGPGSHFFLSRSGTGGPRTGDPLFCPMSLSHDSRFGLCLVDTNLSHNYLIHEQQLSTGGQM